jgi:Transposase, Mutator family
VSRPVAAIDERVSAFLDRPLEGEWPYVRIDATYVKARQAARIVSTATLIAVGVKIDGRREALGLATGPSEAETFRKTFLRLLADCGLRGVKPVIAGFFTNACVPRHQRAFGGAQAGGRVSQHPVRPGFADRAAGVLWQFCMNQKTFGSQSPDHVKAFGLDVVAEVAVSNLPEALGKLVPGWANTADTGSNPLAVALTGGRSGFPCVTSPAAAGTRARRFRAERPPR